MKSLGLLACIMICIASTNTFAGNLVEDLIDFASALPSGGHYLNVRELSEAEIALQIEKRTAQKIGQIANESLKKKIAFFEERMKADVRELDVLDQVREKTNAALVLLVKIRTLIQSRMTNSAFLSENVNALLQANEHLQEGFSLVAVIDRLTPGNEGNPKFLQVSEYLGEIAARFQLTTDEVAQLIVFIEKADSISRFDQLCLEQEFRLKAFKSAILSRANQLEKRIELNSAAIKTLIGNTK